MSDFSEHMLLGVAAKYGKNSDEYEMAGGVRKVDRRRSTKSSGSSTSTDVGSSSVTSPMGNETGNGGVKTKNG